MIDISDICIITGRWSDDRLCMVMYDLGELCMVMYDVE